MNKKLLTAINKFAYKDRTRPILRTIHTTATEKSIITEATNSYIAIRHIEKNSESINFDILQSIDGNYLSPDKYPNLSRLFKGERDYNTLQPYKLSEFISAALTNNTLKNESFEIEFNDITFILSSKLSKIIADTLVLFKNCEIKIGTNNSFKPIHFIITTSESTTEILLTPIRKR